MKIVAVLGSPHGMTGATGTLLNGVLQGAIEAGAEVETFSLHEYKVEPCVACDSCHISGACAISDDFEKIYAALQQADGVVMASPNYIISVSAQLKALLDRLSGAIHQQAFTGKYAAAVITSGSADSDKVGDYLQHALRLTGCTTVGSVGAVGWQMAREESRGPLLEAAKTLGHTLVDAITTRRAYPEQDEAQRQMASRMQTLVTMQKDHWPYEYAYWTAKMG